MVPRAVIEKELDECFPQPFVDSKEAGDIRLLKEDVLRISEFLTDFRRVCDGLTILNDAFKKEMGLAAKASLDYYNSKSAYYESLIKFGKDQEKHASKLKYSTDPGKHLAPSKPEAPAKPPELKKALSRAFIEVEARSGFEASNTARKPNIYLDFVKSDVFNKYLTLKMHWKDPTVLGYHGEYTHRIQWYCIGAMRIVREPGQAFAYLGRIPYPKDPARGLWDFVCDRDGVMGEAGFVPFKIDTKEVCHIDRKPVRTDFRAPEILTRFIIESLKDEQFKGFAELAAFVRMRLKKRSTIKTADNYFAMKVFNKSYASLNEKEKADLEELKVLGVFEPK